jgi:hypothetical protein
MTTSIVDLQSVQGAGSFEAVDLMKPSADHVERSYCNGLDCEGSGLMRSFGAADRFEDAALRPSTPGDWSCVWPPSGSVLLWSKG